MPTRYYRVHSGTEPVERLLSPDRWESRVWVGESYRRCEDCGGEGRTYETDEFCEPCRGQGDVEDVRRGVSCCRSLEALRNYFAGCEANMEGDVVVELEGELSEDEDWDDASGAVLIYPSWIVSVVPAAEVFTGGERS